MSSLFDSLTKEQQTIALSYRGEENHGGCGVQGCGYGKLGWAGQYPCQMNWAGSPEAHREYLKNCAMR